MANEESPERARQTSIARAQAGAPNVSSADPGDSPFADGDADLTRAVTGAGPIDSTGRFVVPDAGASHVVSDDGDAGGPVFIVSDDPALQHIDVPKLEFPGDGVPEFEPAEPDDRKH